MSNSGRSDTDIADLVLALEDAGDVLPSDILASAIRIDTLASVDGSTGTLRLDRDLEDLIHMRVLNGDVTLLFGDGAFMILDKFAPAVQAGRVEIVETPSLPPIPAEAFLSSDGMMALFAEALAGVDTEAGMPATPAAYPGPPGRPPTTEPLADEPDEEEREPLGALDAEDGASLRPPIVGAEQETPPPDQVNPVVGAIPSGTTSDASATDPGDGEDVPAEEPSGTPDEPESENSLFGTDADDVLIGGEDSDRLQGRRGDDQLSGGGGNDRLQGGRGDDVLHGDTGNDRLQGGRGDDRLDGGAGNDRLSGGRGDDVLTGGDGRDRLSGGAGDDTLSGGEGRDRLSGGGGDDTFVLSGAQDARDTVRGGAGEDKIEAGEDGIHLNRFNAEKSSIETIDAGGKDISGTDGKDVIDLTGAEIQNAARIEAGDGNDRVTGSEGDDIISGGAGRDTLRGGAGDDTLIGSEGRDRLEGGEGADTYVLKSDGDVDRIIGFDHGTGDILDVSGIVTEQAEADLSSFLRLSEDRRGNTTVQYNADGNGTDDGFQDIAVLEGVTGLSLDDIIGTQNSDTENV